MKIRKETFIRLFNEPEFLSKDRTKRFISKKKENYEVVNHTKIEIDEKIGISDWIIVKNFSGCAQVLEFKEIGGKTIKQRRIKESVLDIKASENTGIGMLLQYYIIRSNGILNLANVEGINDSQFISLSNYRMHIPSPIVLNNVKHLNDDVIQQLTNTINLSPEKCFSPNFSKIRSKSITTKQNIKNKSKKRRDENSDDEDNERIALRNIQNRKRPKL